MSFEEWIDVIRRRPGMFIGSIGALGIGEILEILFEELLVFREGNPVFEVTMEPSGRISLVIKGINVIKYAQSINWELRDENLDAFGWPCLVALSEMLYVELDNGSDMSVYQANKGVYRQLVTGSRSEGQRILIRCVFDKEIFEQTALDFALLASSSRKFSFLYPGVMLSVSTQDEMRQHVVLHAPNGIVDELKQLVPSESWRYRCFSPFVLNISIDSCTIDVACCYLDLGTDQLMRTYANRQQMYLGGSLQEGILEGIIAVGNRLANEQGLQVQLDRTNVTRNLLLLAAIKGDDLSFRGSTKWELDMPEVEAAVRKRMAEAYYQYLINDEDAARSLLRVFELEEDEDEEDEE